jgi:beta-glucosidase
VSFAIQKTGSVGGAAAAQVYVTDRVPTLTRLGKELKGFTKVYLQLGETRRVSVQLVRDAFSYWDDYLVKWMLEDGQFAVKVCSSSVQIELEVVLDVATGRSWVGL